ncbi:MAG: electron transport complex subunit RsxC [Candidatus Firestonebacteria bacterium]
MQKNDYTKYRFKPKEEILALLDGYKKIYIISCNKCFNELTTDAEPEIAELTQILNESGKTTAGFMPVDFLCNKFLTEKTILNVKKDIAAADAVAVISCGIGTQTIAGELNSPVLTVCDSLPQGGQHGISLGLQKCGACGECYLSLTGGICPIVNCSKELINGACGGAKLGKCEVSKDKDCVWENIFNRLTLQGRQDLLLNQPPKIRNYNLNSADIIENYVKNIQAKRNEGFYGGIYPEENKELAAGKAIQKIKYPETVCIPMLQNAGATCEPLVKPGDKVKAGQKIGEAKANISAVVHSSVSGEVISVEQHRHPLMPFSVLSVIIKSDNKLELDPSVKSQGSLESCSKEDILLAVKNAGIVGMGGAQFPTHIKLASSKPLDTVLLNGCECEPMLNADNRLMLERPEQIIAGLKLLMKAAGVNKGIIAVEDNKPEASNMLREKLAAETKIEVAVVKTKYPQGAERMLIKRILGREVPRGGLPLDVGVLVNNIATANAVYEAVYLGRPLISRIVTVAGAGVADTGNYEIPIGMLVSDIVKFCGIIIPENSELKMGGALMGFPQSNFEVPVIKGTNGIVVVQKKDGLKEEPCIKCGRCVNVCPMELKPHKLVYYAKAGNWSRSEQEGVMNCIECGCCEDICSSKSDMVEIFKKSKKTLRESKINADNRS